MFSFLSFLIPVERLALLKAKLRYDRKNVSIELLGQLKRNARQDAKSGWQGRPGRQPPAKRGGN